MAQLRDTAIDGNLTVKGVKLFYEAGDTVDFTDNNGVNVTGWVDSQNNVIFTIPITKPVIGTPNAQAISSKGFVLRQNGEGCFGSTPASFVLPKICVVTHSYVTGFILTASFEEQTNAIVNAPIAVHWQGTIELT